MTTAVDHVEVDAAAHTATLEETARYTRERLAHNQIFSEHTRESAEKFYRVVRASRAMYEGVLRSRSVNSDVLEYGCGTGSHSTFMARNGAKRVVGIDISDVAIDKAREVAAAAGLRQV